MTPEEIRSAARTKLEEIRLKAEIVFGMKFAAPKVLFDLSGSCAGKAQYSTNTIRLNFKLLKDNFDAFMARTLGHEQMHLCAHFLHPLRNIKPHGTEWRTCMLRMGFSPSRCHTYETKPSRVHEKFKYFCGCKTHEVGRKIHSKIFMGIEYTCKECKEPLKRATGQPKIIGARANTMSGWTIY